MQTGGQVERNYPDQPVSFQRDAFTRKLRHFFMSALEGCTGVWPRIQRHGWIDFPCHSPTEPEKLAQVLAQSLPGVLPKNTSPPHEPHFAVFVRLAAFR